MIPLLLLLLACGETDKDDGSDGTDGEICTTLTWYLDADGDSWGDASLDVVLACERPGDDRVLTEGDCDDSDATINPGGTEICSGADDDCDGLVDEADDTLDTSTMGTWYGDSDSDGYGSPDDPLTACDQPDGTVIDASDCDDSDAAVNPGATEICNDGLDDDCDDLADLDDDSLDTSTALSAYADVDEDGFGDPAAPLTVCVLSTGQSLDDQDCDDSQSLVNPDQTEVCNDGLDNDCDGTWNSCRREGDLSSADLTTRLVGEANYDSAGDSVALVGDVDGDSQIDLMVGVTGEDSGGSQAGAAYLVLGPLSGELDLGDADGKWRGATANTYVGSAVSGAGDVNDDGYDDIIFGADAATVGGMSTAGTAWLVLGPASGDNVVSTADAIFEGSATAERIGSDLSPAGDVDGDGNDDFLIGAYGAGSTADDGEVYLFLGPVSGLMPASSADVSWEGQGSGYSKLASVASVGDLDSDGVADILLGTQRDDGFSDVPGGAAWLLTDPLAQGLDDGVMLSGETLGDVAGCSVAGPGDVDGDGTPDLLIGAYGESSGGSNAGAAYLVQGPVTAAMSLSAATAKLVGEEAGDYAGRAVAGAGDLDADGFADVVVSAPYSDAAGSNSGKAYVLYGPISGSIDLSDADLRLVGTASDYLGTALAGGGDIDGDGVDDALISATEAASGNLGEIYLLPGLGL